MANEFKIKHGFISGGNADIQGDVSISGSATADNGQRIATRDWSVQYLTDNNYATTADITSAISDLTDSAPALLNTLNELAAALGDDPNFATTVTNSIATKLPLAGGTMTGDINLGTGAASIKKTANTSGNYPAVEVYSSGTGDSGSAIAIQQATSEGDTIIFADYEPYVEWGISAENSSNEIHFTGGSNTNSLGSKTFKSNAGSDRTAYKKMTISLSSGNVVIGGTLSASGYNDSNWNTAYSWGNHDGLYDTAGTGAAQAGAVNTRIDDEIIPLIDTKQPVGDYLTSLPSHNHDDRYVKLSGSTMSGNLTMSSATPTLKFSINGGENNAGIVWEDGDAGDPSAQAAAIKWDASSNHMRFYNNDEAAERIRINSDGTTTFLGTINASAGIGGLTLANGGISGTNYNITGVNQLEIADPGEGIVFKAGSSGDMTLAIVDDASDNILNLGGTNASFTINGATVATQSYAEAAAEAVNERIDSEVLPSIPTNNNQLTNGAGYLTQTEGDARYQDATARFKWYSINANGTQAKRYRIARVYYCPKHWDDSWQNIEFELLEESYNASYVRYSLFGYYNGTENQTLNIKVTDFRGLNSDTARYNLYLGTHTDSGWLHSGQKVYYSDVYVDVSYYKSLKITADTFGHSYQETDPTSGAAITVFYPSPEVVDITYTNVDKQNTYVGDNYMLWNSSNFSSTNISNWDTAYGWGNHAGLYDAVGSADTVNVRIDEEVLPAIPTNNNQLTNGAGYITGYTETDTLATVTGRGATTTSDVQVGNWLSVNKGGAATTSEEAGVRWQYNGTTQYWFYTDNANNGDLRLQAAGLSGEGDNTPRLIIPRTNKNIYLGVSGGNVGIGTTSPSEKLDVSGNAYVSGYVQAGTALMSNKVISSSDFATFGSNASTRGIALSRDFNPSLYPDLIINSSGNVGLGTASPIDKLQVDGSLFVTGKIYNGSTNDSAGITFPGTTTRIDGFNGITFHASSTNVGSQSERMRITSSGNIGIGTTTPNAKLHIQDSVAGSEVFAVDGTNGRLFTVTDSLDDSLFSVNTIAGLPVIEAFGDNTVKLGPFTNPVIIDSSGSLSIGGATAATQSYVDTSISNLIGGAPGALNTLNELAAALGDDSSFATTITNSLSTKLTIGQLVPSQSVWSNATRFTSEGDIGFSGAGNHSLQVFSEQGNDAFMAFHISNDHAVYFGLENGTNRLYTGGWSLGGAKHQIWDTRDFTSTNVSNWNTAYGWGNHAGLYDAAGSAGTVDLRIEEEVFPALDTKLDKSGGAVSGQVIFPSAATTKPVLPNGFISRNDNNDTEGRHDIWGISERYYPSNSTAGDAWGIQWSGTPNDIVFVGGGQDKFTISLDEGNIVTLGSVTASGGNSSQWNTAYGWGNHAGLYLGATAKAADSELLDGLNSTAYMRDNGWNSNPGQDADTQPGMSSDFSYANNAPHTGDLIRFGSGNYSLQLSSAYNAQEGALSFRTRNGDAGSWNDWREVWHTGNFNPASYLTTGAKAADSELLDGLDSSVFMRKSANSILDMNNYNIQEVNHITMNDPGYGEGVQWANFMIYECPDDLSNQAGNFHVASTGDSSIRVTVDTNGNLYPSRDRQHTLGLDSNRWQIVFCEILDSAGQHEKNLQNPEGEKSVGDYATGTVLVWKGGKNIPCTEYADHMRMGIAVKDVASPLVQGAEPVLVTGSVNEGDYLITSRKEGHAEAISPELMRQQGLYDCVLGKALENGQGESHLVKTWINI